MQKTLCALGCLALVAVPTGAFAQQSDDPRPPLVPARTIATGAHDIEVLPDVADIDTSTREQELQRWTEEFRDWQKWAAKWSNRRQPGIFTGARDRREKPAPPMWLEEQCGAVFLTDDPLVPACALLAEWQEDAATAATRRARAAMRAQSEAPTRISFLEKVHIDVLWPAMQWQESIYGVLGTHIATTVGKRLQIFLAPGAMLLNVPTSRGVRVWSVATNYGFGYRIGDFMLPGQRPASLHLNIAKAYLLTEPQDSIGGRNVDFVGFSMTFRDKNRK